MKALVRGPAIRAFELAAEERAGLENRLHRIHRQIFDAPHRPGLVRDAFTNEAHDVRVLRTQAGLLPEYRRFNTGFRHLFWECVFHYISRGFPETYFFATPVSPIPYALACRWISRIAPPQRRRLHTTDDPWVRFFLAQNPRYEQGFGMNVLVPFNLQNGWYGAWTLVRRRLRVPVRVRARSVLGLLRPIRLLRATFQR